MKPLYKIICIVTWCHFIHPSVIELVFYFYDM